MLKLIKKLLKDNSLLIAIIVTITITFLSLMKVSLPPVDFTYMDKVHHTIAYMVLGFFWLLAIGITKKRIIIIACILFGVLMEVLQSITSYRTFDYLDMVANGLGVMIGYQFFNIFTKKKNLVN